MRNISTTLVFLTTLILVFVASAFAQQPCGCSDSSNPSATVKKGPITVAAVGKCVPPSPSPLHEVAGGGEGYGTSLECIKKMGMPIPPTPTKKAFCMASDYEEAVTEALRWRKALGVNLSRGLKEEQEIAHLLNAVNSRLGGEFSTLASHTNHSGIGLVDSLLILRVAAVVMREHEQSLVAKRFELEAQWITVWLKEVQDENELVHSDIARWWWRIADIWVKNARSIVGPVLVKEEPFATIFNECGLKDLREIQGELWYKGDDSYGRFAPFDAFYSLECVKSEDPWLWAKFKAMPLELCASGAPKQVGYRTLNHPGLNEKVENLVKELVGDE